MTIDFVVVACSLQAPIDEMVQVGESYWQGCRLRQVWNFASASEMPSPFGYVSPSSPVNVAKVGCCNIYRVKTVILPCSVKIGAALAGRTTTAECRTGCLPSSPLAPDSALNNIQSENSAHFNNFIIFVSFKCRKIPRSAKAAAERKRAVAATCRPESGDLSEGFASEIGPQSCRLERNKARVGS